MRPPEVQARDGKGSPGFARAEASATEPQAHGFSDSIFAHAVGLVNRYWRFQENSTDCFEIQCVSIYNLERQMATTMVHIRIDEQVKAQATEALASMGLSVSDAVRMLLVRVAAEKALPFDVRVPNAETVAAMKELDEGLGKRFDSLEDLMADLNADD